MMGSPECSHLHGNLRTCPKPWHDGWLWSNIKRARPFLVMGLESFMYGVASLQVRTTIPLASWPIDCKGIWRTNSSAPCLKMPSGMEISAGARTTLGSTFSLGFFFLVLSPNLSDLATRFLIRISNSDGKTNWTFGDISLQTAFNSAHGLEERNAVRTLARPILDRTISLLSFASSPGTLWEINKSWTCSSGVPVLAPPRMISPTRISFVANPETKRWCSNNLRHATAVFASTGQELLEFLQSDACRSVRDWMITPIAWKPQSAWKTCGVVRVTMHSPSTLRCFSRKLFPSCVVEIWIPWSLVTTTMGIQWCWWQIAEATGPRPAASKHVCHQFCTWVTSLMSVKAGTISPIFDLWMKVR